MKYKKYEVCDVKEIREGETKKVKAGDKEFLLSMIKGEYFAVEHSCPHYHAPLEEGAFVDQKVICPWHHAAINLKTGGIEEPPALNATNTAQTVVEKGKIILKIPENFSIDKIPIALKPDKLSEKTYVIIGGGPAGYAAAQAMREENFDGRIVMISEDSETPYDRPNLSKEYLTFEAPEEWMPLGSKRFYEEHKIEVRTGERVSEIDPKTKKVFTEKQTIDYDKALIATGASPIELKVEGSKLDGVYYLRSKNQSAELREKIKEAKDIVIIGASFIAMECASSCVKLGKNPTVVASDSVPFEKVLGKEIGELLKKKHEERGVTFKLDSKPAEFIGPGKVNSVLLGNSQRLTADLVIVGVGVKPNADFDRIKRNKELGGYEVNEFMEADNDLFVAGDAACFESIFTKRKERIEHYRVALQQGEIAGRNMAGKKLSYKSVPFFWTRQAGVNIRFVGNASEYDEILYEGDVREENATAFFTYGGKIIAAASINQDKKSAALEALFDMNRVPPPSSIKEKGSEYFLKKESIKY